MKFFFSYSRSVKPEVSKIIELFRAAQHEVWWDADIPELADWWSTILDNIEDCQVFVFVVSEKSVESAYCLAELDYATKRNRPILPFLIEEITPDKIPASITATRNQWFKYNGDAAHTLKHILEAMDKLKSERYKDIFAPRPPEPNSDSTSVAKQFQQASRLAESGYFDEAIKHFRSISSLAFEDWGEDCQIKIAMLQKYMEIAELAEDKSTQKRAKTKWNEFLGNYDLDFDPLDLNSKLSIVVENPPKSAKKDQALSSSSDFLKEWNTKVTEILPEPFEWCFVPEGEVKLGKKPILIPGFAISKFTITFKQFDTFVQAKDGYVDGEWWDFSKTAREWRSKNTKPLAGFFPNSNTPIERKKEKVRVDKEYPRTNVNWLEATAFCRWLSSRSNLNITLPTRQQWQRAAQGDENRKYTWGNVIDNTRCNYGKYSRYDNSGDICDVREYVGGVSPFGVMNMCGNVHEWTQPSTKKKESFDYNAGEYGLVFGGSYTSSAEAVTISSSIYEFVHYRANDVGFRCLLSLDTKDVNS